jgi:hypothetical protein
VAGGVEGGHGEPVLADQQVCEGDDVVDPLVQRGPVPDEDEGPGSRVGPPGRSIVSREPDDGRHDPSLDIELEPAFGHSRGRVGVPDPAHGGRAYGDVRHRQGGALR